ncbi:MAG: mannanase [Ignavibacteria bacterium]
MKRIPVIFLIFTSFVLFSDCSGLFTSEPSFITTKGTQFMKNDEPYYFTGTNFWYGCYLGSPGETGNRERLKRELDFLKEAGITNLRVLAASENSTIKNSLKPAFQIEPGVYNEELLEGLDYLLYEMGKRNMYAVVFLHNFWEWSGGFSQYNAWFGDGTLLDPAAPDFNWPVYGNWVATFYRNEEAVQHHRDYVKMIVTRKNKFTDKFYFEDPAIMAWQLCNEPRPGVGEDAMPHIEYFYKWIDETAGFIHSLDPNHLVTVGNEGTMGSIEKEEVFLTAHKSKNIDYATFHIWPKNWSWYKADDPEGTLPSTKVNVFNYFNEHMRLARELNKPITLEEFGIGRDYEEFKAGTPVTVRDEYFDFLFDVVYDSAAAGAPIAGTNFWTWGGEARAQHDDGKWRPGDDFTGDPPQEPQGLNSIFNTDFSTLKIIKEHSEKMNSSNK